MKKYAIWLVGALLIVGCAAPMKNIQRNHNGKIRSVLSKYRTILNQNDWEIQQSDFEGGFVQAIKPEKTFITITAVYRATVSCSGERKINCLTKISRCGNTVPLSNCSPISEQRADSGDLKPTIVALRAIK